MQGPCHIMAVLLVFTGSRATLCTTVAVTGISIRGDRVVMLEGKHYGIRPERARAIRREAVRLRAIHERKYFEHVRGFGAHVYVTSKGAFLVPPAGLEPATHRA